MSELKVEKHGATEVWTIDGEARRNAINRAMLAEFSGLLSKVANDRSIRCVVLTGAGARAFCAGADLKERAGMSEADVRKFLTGLRETLRSLERSDCIFIAAINGVAFGGGTELALCCDLRIAAPEAQLGLTEVKLGIIPGGGGTQRLSRLIGPGHAKDLILTGRAVDARQALALGLVDRVAEPGKLLETATGIADTIAANGPIAVAAAKHAIDEGLSLDLDDALELEHRFYELTLKSDDRLEGLRAFAEAAAPILRQMMAAL